MSLLDNKYISIYRDADFEAFYDMELKYRWKIILAHIMIHLFPILIIATFYRIYPESPFGLLSLLFSLFLYSIIIIETTSYLFPKSRKLYKKYFLWGIVLISPFAGYIGYTMGAELSEMTDIPGSSLVKLYAVNFLGIFALFIWSHIGLSLVLNASKILYTKKAEVDADVRFATEVQNRILKDVSIDEHGTRAYARSIPANELGGDFFELKTEDNSLYAALGDISGHSFGAGLLMTMTKSAVQTHIEYNNNVADMCHSLNQLLLKQSDRGMYATMVLLRIDLMEKRAELCNAGHLPILHYRKKPGVLEHRYRKGMGLGIYDKAEFELQTFNVEKGDLLFLFSDGLVETRDEKSQVRELPFFENIVKSVVDQRYDSPNKLAAQIFKETEKADHAEILEDDSTIIVIEV